MARLKRSCLPFIAVTLALLLSAPARADDATNACIASVNASKDAPNFSAENRTGFCSCAVSKFAPGDLASLTQIFKLSEASNAKGQMLEIDKLPAPLNALGDQYFSAGMTCLPTLMGQGPGAPAPSPAPASAAAPAPAPAASGKLTGQAAVNALIGNTDVGEIDDKPWIDYYMANGTVKTRHGKTLEIGKWSVQGNKICYDYPGEDEDCYRLEVIGDTVTYVDDSGKTMKFQIVQGNPKGL